MSEDPRDATIGTIGQLKAALAAHEKEWTDSGLEDFDDVTLRLAISTGEESAVVLWNASLTEGEDGDEFYLVADWPPG